MRVGLFVLLVAVVAGGEVLSEVSFNLSTKDKTEEGYTAEDALQGYLQSVSLKWLRYFHVLHAPSDLPQRVAIFGFKDVDTWAQWEEDHLLKTHALFDHFWNKRAATLWFETTPSVTYPERDRTFVKTGGFVWQFKYRVLPGKAAAWKSFMAKQEPLLVAALTDNEGFVEHRQYEAGNFDSASQHMIMWEFLDVPSLARGVHKNDALAAVRDAFPDYLQTWRTAVLAPPMDGDGQQQGYFFPAAGADTEEL